MGSGYTCSGDNQEDIRADLGVSVGGGGGGGGASARYM